MSANIQSMMYVGETPWHGLGTKLENVATAAQAIEAAGLDWKVNKQPVFLKDGKQVPGTFAAVREDNGAILGTVGRVYKHLQNKEAFSFFDAVVGTKDAIYHTAGALGEGEKVWILAKLPGYVRVTGDDVTEKFLLLSNSHDGSSPVQIMFTPIRVVCQNTLNIALRDCSRKQRIRHTGAMGLQVKNVREGLGIINQQFDQFGEVARAMVGVQVKGQQGWKEYLKDVGIMPHDDSAEKSTRIENIIEDVTKRFENAPTNNLPGIKGSVWAAFNAVAEYADWERTARGGESAAMSRAKSLLYGSGAALKQTAWDSAVKLAALA